MSLKVNKTTGEVSYSPYSKFMHESVPMDNGSMIIQLYDFAWDDETRDFKVVEAGKEDRQAYIDSFADDCGVYNVLKKYALTGDASLLNARDGFYGDISDLPEDELNPAKLMAQGQSSLDKLNHLLGTTLTAEELASMSTEQLADLVNGAVPQGEKKEEVKDNA